MFLGAESGEGRDLLVVTEGREVWDFGKQDGGGLLSDPGNGQQELLAPAQMFIIVDQLGDGPRDGGDFVIQMTDAFLDRTANKIGGATVGPALKFLDPHLLEGRIDGPGLVTPSCAALVASTRPGSVRDKTAR